MFTQCAADTGLKCEARIGKNTEIKLDVSPLTSLAKTVRTLCCRVLKGKTDVLISDVILLHVAVECDGIWPFWTCNVMVSGPSGHVMT